MVRLPLLSIPALKQVLHRVSLKYHELPNTIEAVLVKKQQSKSTICKITRRYCNQTDFSIVVYGGKNYNLNKVLNGVKLFDANNLSEFINFPNMKEARFIYETVYIKGEIYVFGGIDGSGKVIKSVEKYSKETKTWENVINMMDDRKAFSASSFMDNVYIIGGRLKHVKRWNNTATCFKFDTKNLDWMEI